MTNDQKIQILNFEKQKIEAEMYPIEVRARVSKKVGDPELNKRCMTELERLQKYLDAYDEEIKQIGDTT